MHVHGFGLFRLDFSINYCLGHQVVGLEGCGWLLVAEFHKNDADVDGFSGSDIQSC